MFLSKKLFSLLSLGVLLFTLMAWAGASLHIGRAISLRESKTVAKALLSPVKVATLEYEHTEFHFTLPKRSALLKEEKGRQVYLVLTSFSLNTSFKFINDYYHNQLPDSSWRFKEQLGSAYIFSNGKANLISTRQTLIRGVERLTYTVKEADQ